MGHRPAEPLITGQLMLSPIETPRVRGALPFRRRRMARERADAFAEEILDFWFGADLSTPTTGEGGCGGGRRWDRASEPPPPEVEARWWNGGEALDTELTVRFGAHLLAVAALFEGEKQRARSLGEGAALTDAQRRLLDAERAVVERGVPAAPVAAGATARSANGAAVAAVVRELAEPFLQHRGGTPPQRAAAAARLSRRRLALVILLDQFSRYSSHFSSTANGFLYLPCLSRACIGKALLFRGNG